MRSITVIPLEGKGPSSSNYDWLPRPELEPAMICCARLDGRGRPSLHELGFRLPAQNRLTGGGGFIQPRDAGFVRGVEDELRIFFYLFGD